MGGNSTFAAPTITPGSIQAGVVNTTPSIVEFGGFAQINPPLDLSASTRELIVTKWTERDPNKPDCPDYIKQSSANKVVEEIADIMGLRK